MPRFKTSDVADAATEQCSFEDLSLSQPLLRSLKEMGCEHPSPVQMKAIPTALAGGDLIVQAKSGTGKTIAFCSIILETISAAEAKMQALVLAPTREIALQVTDELQRLSWYMEPQVSVTCFIGGVPIEEDEEKIQECVPHVVVGTPGRTLKLLREKKLKAKLRVLVLDEADQLLDRNFRPDITAITELTFSDEMQFVAVSATFPPPLIQAAESLFVHVEKKRMKKGGNVTRELPNTVFLCTSAVKKDKSGRALEGEEGENSESAVLKGVVHFKYTVEGYHMRQKVPALLEVLTTAAYRQAFVFCPDSDSTTQIAEMINQAGISAASSSGRMEQAWRTQAFAGLKRFHYRVLVCTDLMARGVDIEQVDLVVNLGVPVEKETYLHRSGRTARFGSIGWSVNIVFEGEEARHLMYFQMQLGFDLADWADRDEAIAKRLSELFAVPEEGLAVNGFSAEQAVADAAEYVEDGDGEEASADRGAKRARRGVPQGQPTELGANGAAALGRRTLSSAAAQAEAARAEAAAPKADGAGGTKVRLTRLKQVEIGGTLYVLDDADAVLAACREAGIGMEHDRHRVEAVGMAVCALGKDPSDKTVKVNVPALGNMWFALGALSKVVDEEHQQEARLAGSHENDEVGARPGALGEWRLAEEEGDEEEQDEEFAEEYGGEQEQVEEEDEYEEVQQEEVRQPRSMNAASERRHGEARSLAAPSLHSAQRSPPTSWAAGPGAAASAPAVARSGARETTGRPVAAAGRAPPKVAPTYAGVAPQVLGCGAAAMSGFPYAAGSLGTSSGSPSQAAPWCGSGGGFAQQHASQPQFAAAAGFGRSDLAAASAASVPQPVPSPATSPTSPWAPLLSSLVPPPVLPQQPWSAAADAGAAPPEWQAWMLGCTSFAEYSLCRPSGAAAIGAPVPPPAQGRQPPRLSRGVEERLNALWAHHHHVWTSVL